MIVLHIIKIKYFQQFISWMNEETFVILWLIWKVFDSTLFSLCDKFYQQRPCEKIPLADFKSIKVYFVYPEVFIFCPEFLRRIKRNLIYYVCWNSIWDNGKHLSFRQPKTLEDVHEINHLTMTRMCTTTLWFLKLEIIVPYVEFH